MESNRNMSAFCCRITADGLNAGCWDDWDVPLLFASSDYLLVCFSTEDDSVCIYCTKEIFYACWHISFFFGAALVVETSRD